MASEGVAQQQAPRDYREMFLPPVNRAMRTLDRSFFRKTIPISAARVFKTSDISKVRGELYKSKDILSLPRLNIVRDISDQGVTAKALLLREDLRHDGVPSVI